MTEQIRVWRSEDGNYRITFYPSFALVERWVQPQAGRRGYWRIVRGAKRKQVLNSQEQNSVAETQTNASRGE